ncbi:MAG: hypothetical protein KAI44_08980 [Methylococcales bacterium]|nr:hypothetical protein [Methylococcales bacterium]MCK5479037.1 hypothetical protein [Methylococcales bacterium]
MKSFLKGLGILFLIVCVLALFVPIGHGVILGEILYYEIKKQIVDFPENRRKERKAEIKSRIEQDNKTRQFHEKLAQRFAGSLTIQVTFTKGNWQQGHVNDFNVWLDQKTGIIWQNYLGFTVDGWGTEQLEQAKQYCHNISPRGYWSLPTNAEFALGVKNKMQTVLPDIKGRWIAQSHSQSLSFPGGMPSIVGFKNQGITATSVRCVARTDKAPAHGYTRDDISNADAMSLLTR